MVNGVVLIVYIKSIIKGKLEVDRKKWEENEGIIDLFIFIAVNYELLFIIYSWDTIVEYLY